MRNADPELSEPVPASAGGGARWLRLVLVLVIGLVLVAPVLLAMAWFRFAGGRFGWVLAAAAFGAFGFLLGWLAVSKHWGQARFRTAAALGIVGVIGGVAVAHFAPPTPARLRDAIRDVAQPNWTLVNEDESGSPACFDECTHVTRQYRVDGSFEVVSPEIERAVRDLKCPLPDPGIIRVLWLCRHGDDIQVDVRLDKGPTYSVVSVTATSG